MKIFNLMLICIIAGGIVSLGRQTCVAGDNWPGQLEQWQKEGSVGRPPGIDYEAPEKQPFSFFKLPARMGKGVVNEFFACGCRLNSQLLTWTLDDKCETGGIIEAFP